MDIKYLKTYLEDNCSIVIKKNFPFNITLMNSYYEFNRYQLYNFNGVETYFDLVKNYQSYSVYDAQKGYTLIFIV